VTAYATYAVVQDRDAALALAFRSRCRELLDLDPVVLPVGDQQPPVRGQFPPIIV
jgi:hypothetical protein